jgi:trk system potassium uptake protein TrkH
MSKFIGSLTKQPARASFAWYLLLILGGAVLLTQSFCRAEGAAAITFLDALFTATSATCVTGLAVRSTGNDFSWFGQAVILLLIQCGGIGIMTVTTYVTLQLGGRQNLRHRMIMVETLGTRAEMDLRWVLGKVIWLTFLFEGVGFLLLALRFQFDHPPLMAFWHALFHSVSAFCNAGFALRDDSLVPYQGDWLVNPTIMLLIVGGGIGFPVLLDVAGNMYGDWSDRWERLTLHSKIMLAGTLMLLALGAIGFLLLEWNGVLRDAPLATKVLAAAFHSTTCRTAGFNTVDVAELTNATLFLTIVFMMIGAGPCSAAGGFKVSTLAVLILRGWSSFRGFRQVTFARRGIPGSVIERATATALIFAAVGVIALTALLIFEQSSDPHRQQQDLFMDAAFEVISALGTVGLSTGMTVLLSPWGRAIIILLMFIGRLGPISVFAALSRPVRERSVQYAQQEPLIG